MRHRSLLVAVAFTAALHAFIGASLIPDLGLSSTAAALAMLALTISAVLTPAPLFLRLSTLSERRADLLAWSGYLAMGLFSTLFVSTVIRDLLLAALAVARHLWRIDPDTAEAARDSAWAVLVLTAAVTLAGVRNARRVARVVRVDVPIAGLPAALSGFTLAQLSDLHIGPTIKRDYVRAIVERTNALDADVVVLTGDIIDGEIGRTRPHAGPLAELRSRHGSYLVTGNHEYYQGATSWIAEFGRLGIRVLLNENVRIRHRGADLLLAGVTDFSGGHFGDAHRSDPMRAAHSDAEASVKILLAHQPRSADGAEKAGFDLQLSGHTHGGQFLPWPLFVPMQQPIVAGLVRVRRLWVYVSRGTGYWGPPIRFGAPSEITLVRLVAA